MKLSNLLMAFMVVCFVAGCRTPAKKVRNLELGMTPEEVVDEMGKPYTIRAAKVFDDGASTQVWEYPPRLLELNPKMFWIYFENQKVVQWGEPGDFTGTQQFIKEYKPFKLVK